MTPSRDRDTVRPERREEKRVKLKITWKTGRYLLLVGLVAVIGLVALGCVRGLAPIGWSGGSVQDGKLYVGSR